MGLDIRACSNLELISSFERTSDNKIKWQDDLLDSDTVESIYEAGFPKRLDGAEEGWYRHTGETEIHSFRAGSYSGYNRWRERLAHMALEVTPDVVWGNWEIYEGRPFAELINFADNEGAFGPKTSEKLLMDFEKYRMKAREYATTLEPDSAQWFVENYDDFARAFALATQGGFVIFG